MSAAPPAERSPPPSGVRRSSPPPASLDGTREGNEPPGESHSRELLPKSPPLSTVETVVHQLENLHDGPQVFHRVVQLGELAIPALERLVRGPSQAIYHSRSLAVDALAAIGTPTAVQALTRALRDSIAREPDPASLEAECVLVNHITEHLSGFSGPEVNEALLAALRRRPYPYCAAALGLIGDPRAIPLLIECLFEDAARPAASAALHRFGGVALAPLIQALQEPRLVAGVEPPTRIDGRAAAARLVAACVGLDPNVDAVALPALHRALGDRQRPVRVEAALALAYCHESIGTDGAAVLAMALDDPNWARARSIVDALVHLGPAAERLIVAILGARPRDQADRRRLLRAVEVAGRLASPAAVAKLRHLAASPDVTLRLTALSALRDIPKLDVGSLTLFLTDREPAVRRQALQALRARRALPPAYAARSLGDADRSVRRLATVTVRENWEATLPVLQQAAYGFGAPLHGWAPRWRLWWHACALMVGALASWHASNQTAGKSMCGGRQSDAGAGGNPRARA